jgi:hypothetical protein
VHFLAFGRFTSAFYYPLGAIVTAGGSAAIAVGVAGESADAVEATASLTAAVSLLSASAAGFPRPRTTLGPAAARPGTR